MIVSLAIIICLLAGSADGGEETLRHGTLKGTVLDRATQQPLVGANIQILDHSLGSIAGDDGRFIVSHVPTGVHRLQISMIGYRTTIRPDVVIRSRRITAVEVELVEEAAG